MDKKKLADFATAKKPIRSSALQHFVKCPMRAVLEHLERGDDESGVAADTGSAMHKMAALLHSGFSTTEAEQQAGALKGKEYPNANLAEAGLMFRYYHQDPRNQKAKFVKVESYVTFTLPPAKEDRTKKEIVITGHLDQIRECPLTKRWELWDIKTTKKGSAYALTESLYQMAAYCYGAEKTFGQPVYPGGLILPRGYLIATAGKVLSPNGIFHSFEWDYKHIPHILNGLRGLVARIRNGDVHVNPSSDYCYYCPAKGVSYCIPKLEKLNGKLSLL